MTLLSKSSFSSSLNRYAVLFRILINYNDDDYEKLGNDYPFGFVRWTEKRNFEAVLEMMSSNVINLKPLISSRFNIEDAIEGSLIQWGIEIYGN